MTFWIVVSCKYESVLTQTQILLSHFSYGFRSLSLSATEHSSLRPPCLHSSAAESTKSLRYNIWSFFFFGLWFIILCQCFGQFLNIVTVGSRSEYKATRFIHLKPLVSFYNIVILLVLFFLFWSLFCLLFDFSTLIVDYNELTRHGI